MAKADDYRKPGDTIDVGGATYIRLSDDVRYCYGEDKSKCPVCGGLGTPWKGWFSCDDGHHVALVDTGEAFAKVDVPALR